MAKKKTAKLYVVDPGKDRARQVAVDAINGLCNALENTPDIVGFALLVWDTRGKTDGCYSAESGPITPDLIPEYAKRTIGEAITTNTTLNALIK